MPSNDADSSNTSLETSSKAFSMSRKMITARLLNARLKVVIGAALCTRVAMASMVPTPLRKPREYGLIGWADHLTLASTNRSMTLEMAGSSEIGRCVPSFFGIGIILAIFHLVGSFHSENDWLMSRRKRYFVASGMFLIIALHTVSSPGAVSFKRCSTSSNSDSVNS